MHGDPSQGEPCQRRPLLYGGGLRPVGALIGLVLAERERTAHRFESIGCWWWVFVLGAILAGLVGIPVLDLTIYGVTGTYSPGMASIFSGVLQILLIVKIAGFEVYPDWVCLGGLDGLIGAVLLIDPNLAAGWPLAGFGLCFALSALVRIWIGMTFRDADAFIWIGASGLVGLFLLAWFLAFVLTTDDIKLDLPMAAKLAVHADLTLRGMALMGFGLSLKSRNA
ncbi:MAG: conserved rane protein of unknown function [Proteobacteria bacterium]|nr:conserved rane protein of unknown function [Pseudomonadota bacterium]